MEFRPIPAHPGYVISKTGVVKRLPCVRGGKTLPEKVVAVTGKGGVYVNGRVIPLRAVLREVWGKVAVRHYNAQVADERAGKTVMPRDGRPASSYRDGRILTLSEFAVERRAARETEIEYRPIPSLPGYSVSRSGVVRTSARETVDCVGRVRRLPARTLASCGGSGASVSILRVKHPIRALIAEAWGCEVPAKGDRWHGRSWTGRA